MTQITTGLILLLVGIPIFAKYTPEEEIKELKNPVVSRDSILRRTYRQEQRFLAHVLRHIERSYRKIVVARQTWKN